MTLSINNFINLDYYAPLFKNKKKMHSSGNKPSNYNYKHLFNLKTETIWPKNYKPYLIPTTIVDCDNKLIHSEKVSVKPLILYYLNFTFLFV